MNTSPSRSEFTTPILIRSNARHGYVCGSERIACPECGEPFGPSYRPAERQIRAGLGYVFCHVCKRAWRELAA